MWLRQAKAVSIEGHPDEALNGLYTHDSTHEGWPVLKNASGMYCYRHTPKDQWFLSTEFTPDKDVANAYIVAKEGPLPVGAHTWQVYGNDGWEDGTLTVGLLVRPPLPSPAACACASLPSAHRCPARGRESPAAAPQAEFRRENGLRLGETSELFSLLLQDHFSTIL